MAFQCQQALSPCLLHLKGASSSRELDPTSDCTLILAKDGTALYAITGKLQNEFREDPAHNVPQAATQKDFATSYKGGENILLLGVQASFNFFNLRTGGWICLGTDLGHGETDERVPKTDLMLTLGNQPP